MNKLNVSTSELIQMSQQEHIDYRQADKKSSPACVELFRRAFDGDEEAWSGIYEIYEPLIKQWAGVQSKIDPEDILQDAFMKFSHYAPQHSSLLTTESLGPILAYLRRCVRTSLLDMIRASNRQPSVDLNELMSDELSDNSTNTIDQSNLMIVFEERLTKLVKNRKEKLVFSLRFKFDIPPREIIDQYPDMFENYQEIAAIIQRLTRRFRKDPILQELRDASIGM